jgi:hypothetical protein
MPPATGRIVAVPQVSGLHHRYDRVAASVRDAPPSSTSTPAAAAKDDHRLPSCRRLSTTRASGDAWDVAAEASAAGGLQHLSPRSSPRRRIDFSIATGRFFERIRSCDARGAERWKGVMSQTIRIIAIQETERSQLIGTIDVWLLGLGSNQQPSG